MNTNFDDLAKSGVEMEYTALRNEILKRIELRQQVVSITLTLAGIFLTVGLTTESVALIYPPLATFLAFAWAQNDIRIRHLATYIRKQLETTPLRLQYETFTQEERVKGKEGLAAFRIIVVSHSGIFLFTQLMAIAVEIFKFGLMVTPLQITLLVVDLFAVGFVVWVATKATR